MEKGWQPKMDKWVTLVGHGFDFDVAFVLTGVSARRRSAMPDCDWAPFPANT